GVPRGVLFTDSEIRDVRRRRGHSHFLSSRRIPRDSLDTSPASVPARSGTTDQDRGGGGLAAGSFFPGSDFAGARAGRLGHTATLALSRGSAVVAFSNAGGMDGGGVSSAPGGSIRSNRLRMNPRRLGQCAYAASGLALLAKPLQADRE